MLGSSSSAMHESDNRGLSWNEISHWFPMCFNESLDSISGVWSRRVRGGERKEMHQFIWKSPSGASQGVDYNKYSMSICTCAHTPPPPLYKHAVSMPWGKIHKPHTHPHHPVTSSPFRRSLSFLLPRLESSHCAFAKRQPDIWTGLREKKKKSCRAGYASIVVSLTSFEWQLSSWLSSTLMLCSTQSLFIITLYRHLTSAETEKKKKKNGTQPSVSAAGRILDLRCPAVQGSSSWISEELSRHGPNP